MTIALKQVIQAVVATQTAFSVQGDLGDQSVDSGTQTKTPSRVWQHYGRSTQVEKVKSDKIDRDTVYVTYTWYTIRYGGITACVSSMTPIAPNIHYTRMWVLQAQSV